MRGSRRRGAKALVALALVVPALATATLGARPAAAVGTKGEIYIQGRGTFSTDANTLELPTAPRDAYNDVAAPLLNDQHWLLIGYKLNGVDGFVEVSAPQGQPLRSKVGVPFTGAVGLRSTVPGILFDGCETQGGQFIIDYLHIDVANHIDGLAMRFEHHCAVTTVGSITWNAPGAIYAAHRATEGGNPVGASIDFGSVSADGGSSAKTVTLTNTGDVALSGIRVQKAGFGSDDFTIVNNCNGTVTAGNTCTIGVTATPQLASDSNAFLVVSSAFTGEDNATLKVAASGQQIPLHVLGTGIGKARIELQGEAGNPLLDGARSIQTESVTSAADGSSLQTTSGSLSLTMNGAPLNVGTYVVTGASAPAMSLSLNGIPCSGLSGRLTIVESVVAGQITHFVGRFQVRCGNDRNLVGQIVLAPTGPVVTRLIAPATLAFANTAVGEQSGAQSVTFTNQGGTATTVSARLVGAQLANFSLLSNTCAGPLDPGKSCNVAVVFAPQTVGPFSAAAVAFADTFTAGGDQRVFFSGTGTANANPNFVWNVDGEFVPLAPTRIFDTRSGLGQEASGPGKLNGGQPRRVQVSGAGGVPASGAGAVVMNVTVDQPTSAAYLTVYPSAGNDTPPLASNLNYVAGQTVPNLVIAQLGEGGSVSVYTNSGATHVIFDVVGWITSDFSNARGARLVPVTPQRLLDTRTGTGGRTGAVNGGESISLHVADPNDGYTAAVLNLTGVEPTAANYVTAYPSDLAAVPLASNLNLVRGQVRPNLVMVQLGADGNVKLFNNTGQVNLVADLVGLFKVGGLASTQTGRIKPFSPSRIIDTRSGAGALNGGLVDTWDAGVASAAVGLAGMEAGTNIGFLGNFTAVNATAGTYLTAFPADADRPLASNLNVVPGEAVPNLSVVGLSTANKFKVFNFAGGVDYIFDVVARIAK